MRGSYYDVLGVPSSASQAEIKARYLRMIRHYHPDRNRSPLAHVRTAEINEAFRFLSDPDLRAWHDAQLAALRQDLLTARARELARGNGRAVAVRPRRRSLLCRYGARIALAVLLAGTAIAGWQIERQLAGGDAELAALASDSTDARAQAAVQALEVATAREAYDMPPVSAAVVARGMGAYRRIAASGTIEQAPAFSERCQAQAADANGWDGLDFCVAFDQAAFVGLGWSEPSVQTTSYFVDRHDRAAHFYMSRLSNLDAIDERLGRIRAQVGTPPPRVGTARVLHGLTKRGLTLADAAWAALNGADGRRANQAARDF